MKAMGQTSGAGGAPLGRTAIGIAADHGGLELKEQLPGRLHEAGHEVAELESKG